jgi:hypothetical protein
MNDPHNPANVALVFPPRLTPGSPDPQEPQATSKSTRKRRIDTIIGEEVTEVKGIIKEQRKERNREHAKRSRQRKKSLTENLQQSLITLKEENTKLREEIYTKLGSRKKVDSMVESKVSISTDQFIEELKGNKNLVVDDETKSFLKTLTKDAMKCADEFSRIVG